jgi:glycosyltransferase involved in cell wall biosynthesis
MNILFVYSCAILPENGGVQRVTDVLQKYFKEKGVDSYYLSIKKNETIKSKLQYFLPKSENINNKSNIEFYINLIKEKKIDIVINQNALGGALSEFCSKAKKETNVKIISVIHNSLLGNVINYADIHDFGIPIISYLFKLKISKKILLALYILKYKYEYKYMHNNSDKVILLSENFYEELKQFTICDDSKVDWIPNPLTIKNDNNHIEKENILLYVGRIDTTQKKVDYLLKIWSMIYKKYPDWRLSIVGDGEESEKLENIAKKKKLERVTFHGKQNPIPFYKKAKILCMTSTFEGFPLVLAEAQSCGTVPIAFNSFKALSDVITKKENGVMIEPFDFDMYFKELSSLMEDTVYFDTLSANCKLSVDRFSLESVGDRWIKLFHALVENMEKK